MKNELDGIKCPKGGGTSGAYFLEWQQWACYYKWDGIPNGGEQVDGKGGGMLTAASPSAGRRIFRWRKADE